MPVLREDSWVLGLVIKMEIFHRLTIMKSFKNEEIGNNPIMMSSRMRSLGRPVMSRGAWDLS